MKPFKYQEIHRYTSDSGGGNVQLDAMHDLIDIVVLTWASIAAVIIQL